jgi:hypothetical protein
MSGRDERPSAATEGLRASFEPYTKRELADMLAHVVKTYVIDGTTPQKPELGIVDFPRHLRDLSFIQLVAHLKMHLDLPELNLFTVQGGEVLVKIGGRDYSLSNPYASPPPPVPQPAEPGRPAGRGEPSAPQTPAQPAADQKPTEPVEISDRFKLLELD